MSLLEDEHKVVEAESVDSADPPFFAANERILVFHGPLLYEGKILNVLESRHVNGERLYDIHYSGWNKKWDEHVPESRVLKYNDDNLKRQKEHKRAHDTTLRGSAGGKKSEPKSGGGGGGKPQASAPSSKNTTSNAGDSESNVSVGTPGATLPGGEAGGEDAKGTKPKGQTPSTTVLVLPPDLTAKKMKLWETQVEQEVKFMNKQVVDLGLPDKLKSLLLTDFDIVNRQKRLLNLPGRYTVDSLLKGYADELGAEPTTHESQLEFVEGVKDYFNIMLGGQLLYRFERLQYAGFIKTLEDKDKDVTEDDVLAAMSGFYGPVHLLRLFTKLGSALALTDMDQATLALFKIYVRQFFEYLMAKEDEFFQEKNDYGMSQPEYQRKEPL